MYRALVPVYLRGAEGALVVYDITDRESFASLTHWFSLLVDGLTPETVVFLIANKIDLIESAVVPDETGAAYANGRKASFFKVSAMTGEGIDQVFVAMAREIMKRVMTDNNSDKTVPLGAEQDGGCC
jgi:GTPase SAR1 family protein